MFSNLLIDQVEFADVILISKTDLVESIDVERLIAILKALNTSARIIPIKNGQINIDEVLDTGLFNFEQAQQSPGWLKEMRGEHVPETEEYGISSFSYAARRPFHPEKFYQFLHSTKKLWKTDTLQRIFLVSNTSTVCRSMESGRWYCSIWVCWNVWKAVPKENWPIEQEYLDSISENWVEPFGDMRQELVFIGQDLDQSEMIKVLDSCLLSEDEVLKGKNYWVTLTDPFPAWENTV